MEKRPVVYPYVPNSVPKVKAQMLKEVKAKDIMDLYAEIPERLRFKGRLKLPEPIPDEYSIRRHVEELLGRNGNTLEYNSFLGAGCADHFVPAVCDEINGRGEFLTAYVGDSYADHGKWQALFEYASLMGELLDMDILSCPVYDGMAATATALRMASRATGRKKVLIAANLNPDTLLVVRNYLKGIAGPQVAIEPVGFDKKTGLLDLADLEARMSADIAAVLIENPNYFGLIETQAEKIGRIAKKAGAEYVVNTDPISLGVIAPPAQYGATFACGDLHSLGLHQACGGGQAGFVATPDKMRYIAEFKDLMFGLAGTSVEGEYGFGEVLYDRTSYGSREKGKEFTGTTTGLWAITAGVYLALMGPKGMQEVGQAIMQKLQYAVKLIARIKGVKIMHAGPAFKEFVVNFDKTGKTVKAINKALLKYKVFGGKDISAEFPEYGQSALYCVTEKKTKDDIDKLADALRAVTR
jgi:glycine dehydrogenase subunit 1